MKSFKHIVIPIVLVALIVFIVFWKDVTNSAYQRIQSTVGSIFGKGIAWDIANQLTMENQRLRFELAREESEEPEDRYLNVSVYSQYPFNDKAMFIISAGKEEGVAIGMPVLTPEQFLVGIVINVRKHQAEVQTFFDVSWRSSVAIGTAQNKAVLEGGQSPRLELIGRTYDIEEGDNVFNIDSDFPYAQLVGSVAHITDTPGNPWRTGSINIRYDVTNLVTVLVVTDFP